ncbi:hypothetical protein BP6252_06740 [Coleophoma cylindrospora]|uniref:Xylanolytic transcriptional activator regulatory domain-containing protein n=1 Tax=Coleophoma cylindrospora TaxID=1849047 RepID=A0A3D8RFK3_9HELO|nr:hypothetical protein BP6252_06740 [Coleophoma cylindrospora]
MPAVPSPEIEETARPKKRARTTATEPPEASSVEVEEDFDMTPGLSSTPPHTGNLHAVSATDSQTTSSSTMSLIDGAFQLHSSATPKTLFTDALPGGHRKGTSPLRLDPPAKHAAENVAHDQARVLPGRRHLSTNASSRMAQSLAADLISLLPAKEVAELLVDTYFDRVHWFILIFHQDSFRERWPEIYDSAAEKNGGHYQNPGFISTFLMVMAIGSQYSSPHTQHLLSQLGVSQENLQDKILLLIKAKLLDIASLGSLEAVQTCVLLGTYYLYHGRPELAWPVCGCGLRVAQALSLHRTFPLARHDTVPVSLELRREYDARKRCWWAVYEIETFCSMSYGYPLSIQDSDCDIDLLEVASSFAISDTVDRRLTESVTLRSYKHFMSKLSIIIKATLVQLYGISQDTISNLSQTPDSSVSLRRLIQNATALDSRLQLWRKDLPNLLRLNSSGSSPTIASATIDIGQGTSTPSLQSEDYIYQLQALTLEFTYQNARILIHRPLLSYRMARKEFDSSETHLLRNHNKSTDPFSNSLRICQDAGLATSEIGSLPIFLLSTSTYASTFFGIHTFTAGITLCILSSIEPLTLNSQKSKIGLRKLMAMQTRLKSVSKVSVQGAEILQRLARLVMEKELNELLDTSPPLDTPVINLAVDDEAREPQRATIGTQARTAAIEPYPTVDHDTDDTVNDGFGMDIMENSAMSQALVDLDQVFASQMNSPDPNDSILFPELGGIAFDSFLAQEQAWIWGWNT